MKYFISLALAFILFQPALLRGQAADWQKVVWREPQVRYLMADMTLGGSVELYRNYAMNERDPDSAEAIRLWDAGVRAVNKDDFERKWVPNQFGKDGKVMRIVLRGSNRMISGAEVLLTSDTNIEQAPMRLVLLDLTLGAPVTRYEATKGDPNVAEALRRWANGARVSNVKAFEVRTDGEPRIVYRGTRLRVDGAQVRLNSDVAYPEVNARYFLADICLGGSRDFYHRAAEAAHEMGCQEAVARYDSGVKVANLDQLERKVVNGKTIIARKGTNERIKGDDVKLSTD